MYVSDCSSQNFSDSHLTRMPDRESRVKESTAVGKWTVLRSHSPTLFFLLSPVLAALSRSAFDHHQHPRPRSVAVEEEIYLLDTSPTSGGKGGGQGEVGCRNGSPGTGQVGEGEAGEDGLGFYEDTSPLYGSYPSTWPEYTRHTANTLGDREEPAIDQLDGVNRCFNCGSPSHSVVTCQEPTNRPLIDLSRQMFLFYRDLNKTSHQLDLGVMERIHTVEMRKQQALDFLDFFEPGEIRGPELRNALGLDGEEGHDGEWLKNIALWGYPPGWVGERDPRYEVSKIIEGEVSDSDEEEPFIIFGDGEEEFVLSSSSKSKIIGEEADESDEEEERCIIFADGEEELLNVSSPKPRSTHSSKQDEDRAENFHEDAVLSTTRSPSRSPTKRGPAGKEKKMHRWAVYPPTQFSSALLPTYTGYALPAFGSDTFDMERPRITVPRPPCGPPPPPPPPPPGSPPPEHPPDTSAALDFKHSNPLLIIDVQEDSEADMELSDSD